GMSEAAVVDETAPLAPQTEYARSKAVAEEALRALADDRFSPVYCRNGTVYGLSPRMRFDTVLNNFMGSAFTTGRVEVHSDGTPWRPVVHVQDVARYFKLMLEAPLQDIHNE
ncbi:MAG: SDR family oxidoreductase, partial [Mesorhizobium sp.]